MTIRSLLNSGRSDETTLEKVADAILAYPRAMWLGKSVHVVRESGDFTIDTDQKQRSLCGQYGKFMNGSEGAGILGMLGSPLLLVANILATPFLCVGLLLKKIAVIRDPEAKKVNEKVEQYQQREKLVAPQLKELRVFQKVKSKAEKEISTLSKLPDEPSLRQRRRDIEVEIEKVSPQIQDLKEKIDAKVNATADKLKQMLEGEKTELVTQRGACDEQVSKLRAANASLTPKSKEHMKHLLKIGDITIKAGI